ncbi:Hpt domain-containing protein [Allosphingosinicella flava]|uniref:Hpt domain-containing protein n=1 Tax=Allosphingosinicella flava TaxID=2771430 RepID=A0A7T2GIE6_9SPHN|nr:Hpt domain-containing protein [Sphingosinicella flava]QPQ54409.1 Hpt domain-containing protein [Sphingosinicella flava]
MTMLEDRLAALRAAFIDRSAADLAMLDAAVAAEPMDRAEAARIAHRFAGAAGLYGFGALGEAASALEAALNEGAGRDEVESRLGRVRAAGPPR